MTAMLRSSIFPLVLLISFAAPLPGQEAGWDGEVELGASFLFGANEQSLVASRFKAGHADSSWEKAGEGRFQYGTSTDDLGESHLSNRAWNLDATVVYLPFAVLSYFASAGVESSFQRKIDTRWTGGGGIVYNLIRDATTQVDLRAGLLAEKTAFDADVAVDPGAEDLLARATARLHGKHAIDDDRIVLESETTYRPELDDFGRYVVATSNSAAYLLTETFALKLSLVDVYDTEAAARGANSDHDGQVLISVLGSF